MPLLLVGFLLLNISCIKKVPINEVDNESDYEHKKSQLETIYPDYYKSIEELSLTTQESEYIRHLIAYMPVNDFADYDFEFWLRHVRFSIKAKDTFSWADSIPEDIFLAYVLPPRVNNENLDTARMVFYRELKELFEGKEFTPEKAVLEINHWCNSKVIYRGTDERTISPLAAVRSGFGRCGEESTFAVTALRAAGIPARQVYTPRWVHTDDNHAWVEVWIDGSWYYLGACEPAPVLNTGWFDLPATRAMLVHTKQFGVVSDTVGDVLTFNNNFTWINALDKYAPTKTIKVWIVNENNVPLNGANVRFQVYNYAEMFPLHETNTGVLGFAEFSTGYGSIEVFVSKNGICNSVVVAPQTSGIIKVVLEKRNIFPGETVKYFAPVPGKIDTPDEELVSKTANRIKQNEKIRKKYEASFYNEFSGKHFAETFGYNEDIITHLITSRGNFNEIESFLIEASYLSNQLVAAKLLSVISEKDLRDANAGTLSEHLKFAPLQDTALSDYIYQNYVLNPRVEFEVLKPYRKEIINTFSTDEINDFRNNPKKITQWINVNIKTKLEYSNETILVDELNNYNVPISPMAVNKYKLADKRSLKIYAVALFRTVGVPAKIDSASGIPQYYHNGTWHDMFLSGISTIKETKRGQVFFINRDSLLNLKYRSNFAIAVFINGIFETLDLGWDVPIESFSEGVDIPVGKYMLLTSRRSEDGSVLVNRSYFEIAENEILYLQVTLPIEENESSPQTSFNQLPIFDFYGNNIQLGSLTASSEYSVFVWLNPGTEPSKHIVHDLELMMDKLIKSGVSVYFLVDKTDFIPNSYDYPSHFNYYLDKNLSLLSVNSVCKSDGTQNDLPIVVMLNSDNKVVFNSSGYIIGIGDVLLQKLQ